MAKIVSFKVANSTLCNYKSYKDCQSNLLPQKLSNKKSKCRSENNKHKVLKNEIVSVLSVVGFTHFITKFTNSNDKILRKVQETHKKNLYKSRFFERNKECNDPNQVIINFSSSNLMMLKSRY